MRHCKGCSKLTDTGCSLNFNAVKSEKQDLWLRPNNCFKKYREKEKLAQKARKDYKKLVAKLDDIFQMYVRYRDNWTCCCCGKRIAPDSDKAKLNMHAGHYVSRKVLSLRWDEKNVHAQCRTCNMQQNYLGIDPRYTRMLIIKYGQDIINYLTDKRWQQVKFSCEELEEKIKYYSDKLAQYKK